MSRPPQYQCGKGFFGFGLGVSAARACIAELVRSLAVTWAYRLGNRSVIDWVLDHHKEMTPRDPKIREKFNSYRFADYKESCIDLIAHVVTVSVEMVATTGAMKALGRLGWD